jgi:predicted enzyme related to lactoylglutathione lyase
LRQVTLALNCVGPFASRQADAGNEIVIAPILRSRSGRGSTCGPRCRLRPRSRPPSANGVLRRAAALRPIADLDRWNDATRAVPTNQEATVPAITKLDFVAIPSQDGQRARAFYGETLGLRPDGRSQFEFWVGETCLGIWEPEQQGMPFAPQKNGHIALHVDDVAAARTELEAAGVEFAGETIDTGVCHMALFTDPDGNDLMLHSRYAPTA